MPGVEDIHNLSEGASVLEPDAALTPFQRRIWASQRRLPGTAHQNMATLTWIGGPVETARLSDAFDQVVALSDILRLRVTEGASGTVEIADDVAGASEIIDLPQEDALAWATARARRVLDLSERGFDSVILRHPDGTASWFLTLHHMLTDASGSAEICRATADVYRGLAPQIEPFYGPQRLIPAKAHDNEALIARPDLRFGTSDLPPAEAIRLEVPIEPGALDTLLARLTRERGVPSRGLVASALMVSTAALWMHRLTGERSVALGLPVSERAGKNVRYRLGPRLDLHPVRIDIEDGDTFAALLDRTLGALFETLKTATQGTDPDQAFAGAVNVLNRDVVVTQFGDWPARMHWLDTGAIDPDHLFRLHLSPYEAEQDAPPRLLMDVQRRVCGPVPAERLAAQIAALLGDFADRADEPLGARSLAGAEDLAFLNEWESCAPLDAPGPLIAERLERALSHRDDVVLREAAEDLTGRALWSRVLRIAGGLVAAGAGPGTRIGVALPPSSDAVTAIYAVLVSGASFVPLDPVQSPHRAARLAARAGLFRTIASRDDLDMLAAAGVDGGPLPTVQPQDEAYLLFTSGSTGQPKGVPISHAGLAEYLDFALASYFEVPGPVAPLFGALTFDLTLTTLFAPILAGGRLIAMGGDNRAALGRIAAMPEITWAKATPSHLRILLRLLPDRHGLATLVVGGEAFERPLAKDLLARLPGLAIFNEYGPTEAVVGCMIHRLDATTALMTPEVPIGVPAPGVALRIMDGYGQRQPVGMPGELWITRAGLTGGYLDETGPGPFSDHEAHRFYRTGDLVRLDPDGALRFLGRIDQQIKVGGVRLDPSEIEAELLGHPLIEQAAVRLWAPRPVPAQAHCLRCGLADTVPGAHLDGGGICSTCHAFDRVRPMTEQWFKTPDDLAALQARTRQCATGAYDCLHMLSGGKDSTYALYRLVEMGYRVYALTLDNGFISEQAKGNIRRIVDALGIDHEFATTPAMNAIFRDSLATYSNVCQGCFKTLYTLATNRALALGIPMVVSGLSRGQLFETRLIPQQFAVERFDPDAIDRAVADARRVYHRVDDAANRLLDTRAFADGSAFERVAFVDFYRYVDVALSEVLDYLAQRTPWLRPEDTGRSTNCLINAAGIHTHTLEQGFHNYAVSYAWDVRLGHKTRAEALEELDDALDPVAVNAMLEEIGYEPAPRERLTAWVRLADGAERMPSLAELRAYLAEALPRQALPVALARVNDLPLSTNGKLDAARLPAPERTHRSEAGLSLPPTTQTERAVVAIWEKHLRIEPIGVADDFFALGGDSLAALEMVVALSQSLGKPIREEMAFTHTTAQGLAAAVDAITSDRAIAPADIEIPKRAEGTPPLSRGEETLLLDQSLRPDARMYNVARVFHVAGPVDAARFSAALRTVAPCHEPLVWTYGRPRRAMHMNEALEFDVIAAASDRTTADRRIAALQARPFDLSEGPALRCQIQTLPDETTLIAFIAHHVRCDHESFDRLWEQIQTNLQTGALPDLPSTYSAFTAWQAGHGTDSAAAFWRGAAPEAPASLALRAPQEPEPDGYLTRLGTLDAQALRAGSGTMPVAIALAAAAAAVRPYFDGPDLQIGLIASARTHGDACPLFGYLLNTLPLDVPCAQNAALSDLAALAGRSLGAALPHRGYAYADILADRRAAGLASAPVDVLLAYDDVVPADHLGARTDQHVAFNGFAVARLGFFVELGPEGVTLGLEYSGKSIGKARAAVMLERFALAIEAAVRAPATTVAAMDGAGARQSLLVGPQLAHGPPLIGRIVRHAETLGDRPAVCCGDDVLDWAGLGQQSAAIARDLGARGVGPGDRVGLQMRRSTTLIAAIAGVQRAGAAYVPIDPDYPALRQSRISAGAGLGLVLCDPDVQDLGVPRVVLTAVGVDGTAWEAVGGALPDLPAPDDPAYVIFTSGSTGVPSGVAVNHAQLAASTDARAEVYDAAPSAFVMLSSPAFDSSIVGIFWTLAQGGCVVLPAESEVHDIDALLRVIQRPQVSHLLCVPTLYAGLLARRRADGDWPRQNIVAGERCDGSVVRAHFAAVPDARLTNEYGPTETTVWASAHHCTPEDGLHGPPIGKVVPGGWLAVVDAEDRICAEGVTGTLIIGGAGVTQGYLDDAEQTQAQFGTIKGHSTLGSLSGTHFFRTGDVASVVGETALYHGRADDQISLDGHRVEPGDIEAVLSAYPGIDTAVVLARDARPLADLIAASTKETVAAAMADAARADDPEAALHAKLSDAHGGRRRLVACLEAKEAPDLRDLRTFVAERLPRPLRPELYSTHTALPRTPNGKLDRAATALLAIEETPTAAPGSMRADTMLERLTKLFAQELGNPAFGPTDDFFDRGGNSLMVLRLTLRIEEAFGVSLSTADLFDAPSPAAFVHHLPDAPAPSATTSHRSLVVPLQTSGSKPPIFAIHHLGENCRYYRPLAARLGPDQPFYGLGDPREIDRLNPVVEDVSKPFDPYDVAKIYATEIERLSPGADAVLIGYCGGGVIAYEVAQILASRGRAPLLNITVSDWHAPGFTRTKVPWALTKMRMHWNLLRRAKGDYLSMLLSRLPAYLRRQPRLLKRRWEVRALERRRAEGERLSHKLAVRDYMERGFDALHGYDFQPYDGRCLIVRGLDDPQFPIEQDVTSWRGLLSNWAIVRLPGFVPPMMQEPWVANLASRIDGALTRIADGDWPVDGPPPDL